MKIRKSVGGFICGLIGAIISSFTAFGLWLVISVALDLITSSGGTIEFQLIVTTVSSILFIVSALLAIIGSCFYFRKARVGGVMMLIAFIFNVQLYIAPLLYGGQITFSMSNLLTYISTILILLSAIFGLSAKAQSRVLPQSAMINQVNREAANVDAKFCQYCGSRIAEGSTFCSSCGRKVD